MGHQSLTSGMELRDNILVSGNADSTVKVWDITTGQCLQTLSGDAISCQAKFVASVVYLLAKIALWTSSLIAKDPACNSARV
jgi:WD40 repeat protein